MPFFKKSTAYFDWLSTSRGIKLKIVILRHISTSSMELLRIKIVNANTELIPEAPNRQAKALTAVVVSACSPTFVEQVAVPSTACIVLRRTPPVTVEAKVGVISIVVAVPARKTSKQ